MAPFLFISNFQGKILSVSFDHYVKIENCARDTLGWNLMNIPLRASKICKFFWPTECERGGGSDIMLC